MNNALEYDTHKANHIYAKKQSYVEVPLLNLYFLALLSYRSPIEIL